MMRIIGLVLAMASSMIGPAQAAIVRTPAGILRGASDGAVVAYRGIPYAAPPLGKLRWRPPQPAGRWHGVRAATRFAPACMQRGVSMPGERAPVTSEDCLYLNIWKPRDADGAPVIVWFPGGGFTNGNAAMPLYWGDRLARRGVVVVTVGYRLGALGYLAHPALTAEAADRTSGNYGLLDQVAALRWVRANITAFGGDPSRVTIAGQSAGAISVSLLLATPAAQGLFSRAIAQSGGLFEPIDIAPQYRLDRAERDGEAYALSVGARGLADLRALPAAALLGGRANSVSHPVIDPVVLPGSPHDAYVTATQHDVPILIGSNAEEARSLLSGVDAIRAATFAADVAKAWGPLPPALLAAYPYSTDAEARGARLAFERDLRFGWDMWTWARLQATHARQPAYYYHFDAQPPFPAGSAYAGWGAAHFAELWYMFDHLAQAPWRWTPADHRLSDAMARYWVNFARDGDPNGADLPSWPRFSMTEPTTMYLGNTVRTGPPANLAALTVFDRTYSALRRSSP